MASSGKTQYIYPKVQCNQFRGGRVYLPFYIRRVVSNALGQKERYDKETIACFRSTDPHVLNIFFIQLPILTVPPMVAICDIATRRKQIESHWTFKQGTE